MKYDRAVKLLVVGSIRAIRKSSLTIRFMLLMPLHQTRLNK